MVWFASLTDGGEQITAEQDRIPLIILGLNGVIGQTVLFNVEPMALKIDSELAILPKRVDIHVHPRCNRIPKLAIMDPAQSTEDSVSGMNGQHAQLNVAVEIKQGQDDVTTLFQNSVVWSVRETLQNANDATWIHVRHLVQLNHFKKTQ